MTSYKPVTASLRVLDVLNSTNQLGEKASVSNIVEETGLDKATTIRMLQTLIHAGYVLQDHDRIYRPTGKTLGLSSGFVKHKVISGHLSLPLKSLFETIDWPSDLAVRDGDEMMIISSSRFGGALSFNRQPNHRAPILPTSLGLAYLAYCPEEEREELIDRIGNGLDSGTVLLGEPVALNTVLNTVREQGFATTDKAYREREFQNRIEAMGVPILVNGAAVAAINVIYLRSAITFEQAQELLLPKLQMAAREMGQVLQESGSFSSL